MKERECPEYIYDDATEEQDVQIEKILNYPVDQEEIDLVAYDLLTDDGPTLSSEVSEPLRSVLGAWNGFIYWTSTATAPTAGMISLMLQPATADGQDGRFQASGKSNASDFTVSGECHPGDTVDTISITFTRSFPAHFPSQYWHGQLNTTTETITGEWGNDPDYGTHHGIFVLKRTAPEFLCFRPAPVAFETNKARALWSFALSAIRYQVHRQSWSWDFFRKRRNDRKRFIELYIRATQYGCPLKPAESEELSQIRQSFTTSDSRFYHSLAKYKIRRIIGHE